MSDVNAVLAASLVLWSGILLYLFYLHIALRRVERKVQGYEGNR